MGALLLLGIGIAAAVALSSKGKGSGSGNPAGVLPRPKTAVGIARIWKGYPDEGRVVYIDGNNKIVGWFFAPTKALPYYPPGDTSHLVATQGVPFVDGDATYWTSPAGIAERGKGSDPNIWERLGI